MAISVRCRKGVKASVRKEIRRLAKLLPRVSAVRHDIHALLVPEYAVEFDGRFGLGAAHLPVMGHDDEPCFITVAAGLYDLLRRDGESRREAIDAVAEVFLHEFAHYEQFRDSRPLNERGVHNRALGLYRKLKRQTCRPALRPV